MVINRRQNLVGQHFVGLAGARRGPVWLPHSQLASPCEGVSVSPGVQSPDSLWLLSVSLSGRNLPLVICPWEWIEITVFPTPPPRYKIITGPSQQAGVAPWDNTVPADTSFLLVWALAVNHTRGTRMQERGCRRSGKARHQFWVFCLLQVLVLLADHLTSLLTAYRRRSRETGTCRGSEKLEALFRLKWWFQLHWLRRSIIWML